MIDAPLRETVLLLAGMATLSVPLIWVTADRGTAAPRDEPSAIPPDGIRSDIEVVSAHPLEWLQLSRQSDGEVIGRLEGPFTFGEFEAELPLGGEGLLVSAKWSEGAPRSALRVELLPDGFPTVSKSFWGRGQLQQTWEVSFDE